jgi:hypothetical protein
MIVPDETQDVQQNHTSVWLLAQHTKAIKEVNNARRVCITDTPVFIQFSKSHKINNLLLPPHSLALQITVTFPG